MDVHVQRQITIGLRLRAVDVLTAQEDGSDTLDDPPLLDRATVLRRAVFTRDEDFLVEATRRLREGLSFATVIYAHQLRVSIGQCISDLEIFAKAASSDEVTDRIVFLPL
jgi:hypothetical protein